MALLSRCLQETESSTAHKHAVITAEEREAVTMFQGHSSTTSRLFYQKEKMSDISESALNAHRAIYGDVTSSLPDLRGHDDDIYSPDQEEVDFYAICECQCSSCVSLPQGFTDSDEEKSAPPHHHIKVKRLRVNEDSILRSCPIPCPTPSRRIRSTWSSEEEEWLILWVKRHVDVAGTEIRIPWKSCVSDIRCNPVSAAIFDPSHVTPTAVHEACKRIAKRQGVVVSLLGNSLAC